MQWLLALGKLAAGWLVVWLLYKAIVDPIIVDRIQRLVGRDRGRKRRIQRQMRTQRLVLLLSSERGRRRRRMVRLAALHLAMLGWTWVVAWAWDTVPYEGILDLFVYYISRVCAASIISSSIISLLETLVTMAKVPTLLATSSSSGAGERIKHALYFLLSWSLRVLLLSLAAYFLIGIIGTGFTDSFAEIYTDFFEFTVFFPDKFFQAIQVTDWLILEWLFALYALFMGWLIVWGLHVTIVYAIPWLVGSDWGQRRMVRVSATALKWLGWIWAIAWAWGTLPYEGIVDQVADSLIRLMAVIITIHSANDVLAHLLANFFQRVSGSSSSGGEILKVLPLLPILRTLFWFMGFVYYLQSIGVDLEVIWAAVVTGGVGIGLALQKPTAEFFEYIYIFLDKPFQKKDLLDVAGTIGSVEDVGIRSTQLRTPKGELVIIPNSSIMNQPLRNHSHSRQMPPPTEHGVAMGSRRLVYRFGVISNTPLEKVETIPNLIHDVINDTEDAMFERCHFVQFGSSSLDFELSYTIPTNDYIKAMNVQQEVNLGIMRAFAQQSISLCLLHPNP